MKYLCLVHYDEAVIDTMPRPALDALVADSNAYDRELEKSGHLIVAHALAPVQRAKVVQVHGGQRSHVDGPFAEAREQLGGFLLVEARDLNAAIQIAGRVPMARHGAIEVRAIEELQRRAV